MAGFIPFIPAAVSVGAQLLGGGDSGGGGGQQGTSSTGVPFYTPTGLGQADSFFQQELQTQAGNNPYVNFQPQYQAVAGQIQNNPFASLFQGGANMAGGVSTAAGTGLANLSGVLSGEAGNLSPYMGNILNMGFDPQSQLYASLFQKINDQANVTNAQYGLTGQQAAGNVQQADTNFNMDWQNQQLQRALQGISGAGQIGQTQAGLSQAAGQAGTGAAGLLEQGGAIPYNAFGANIQSLLSGTNQQAAFGALQNQIPASVNSQIIPYLNYGAGATNAGVNAAGANTAANTAFGAGLGGLTSQLSGLFGGSSPFSGGGFLSAASNADSTGSWFGSPTGAGSASNLDFLNNMAPF